MINEEELTRKMKVGKGNKLRAFQEEKGHVQRPWTRGRGRHGIFKQQKES